MRPPMLREPERVEALVLGATANVAVPGPEPLPFAAVIHETVLDDDQLQPAAVETVTDMLPPANGTDMVVGETVIVHPAPSWLTVNVSPPIVSVPTRACVAVFAAALNETVPFPLPLAPAVTVSQLVLLVADHAHPVSVATDVEPVPPVAATVRLVGVSVVSQAAAAWFTVNVRPATLSAPERASGVGFAAAVNVTVPLPLPFAPAVMASQSVAVVEVHAHPDGAVTAVEPLPPAATTDWLPGEIE
jgi:hypothetical protein